MSDRWEVDVSKYVKTPTDREPKVWLVRALHGQWTQAFVENGYIGIGYDMDGMDLSKVENKQDIHNAYVRLNPDKTTRGAIRNAVSNIAQFQFDITVGDYVFTPDNKGVVWWGRVIGVPEYHPNIAESTPCANRRPVAWSPDVLEQIELQPMHRYVQRTIYEIRTPNHKRKFFELVGHEKSGEFERVYTIDDILTEGVFFKLDELKRIIDRFKSKKNLILQGPPGVGKTFFTRRLAYALMSEKSDKRIVNVQFHQSYSYEDFVQGYRVGVTVAGSERT